MNYRNSGVNIKKGNNFVEEIKKICGTKIIGGFGGIYEYNGIKLIAATDGVGSKLELCRIMNKYETIGIDLVAMCVNDIICHGGKPLFFLDYYAMGKLDIEKGIHIIQGINEGCKQAHCILLGGETAEMPLIYNEDKFDLAGFSVGIIEKEIYPKKINKGDLIFGLSSTGIHSNGYTLIHKLLKEEKHDLEELITPTKIYVDEIEKIKLGLDGFIKGFSHITGGGIVENIKRILNEDQNIHITEKWKIPKIFSWIYNCSDMTSKEMFNTYNCGIGMVIIVHKNINLDKNELMDKYKLIPMGKIIESDNEIIDYENIF